MHLPFDNCSQVHQSVATRVFLFDHVHHQSKVFEHASRYRCVSVYIFMLNSRRKYTFSNKQEIESKNSKHIYNRACGSLWARPSLLKKSPVSKMVEDLGTWGFIREWTLVEKDLWVSRHSVREKMEEDKPRYLKGGQRATPRTFIEILWIVNIYCFLMLHYGTKTSKGQIWPMFHPFATPSYNREAIFYTLLKPKSCKEILH